MYLVAETDRANKANEDLLNNVLPKSIAARLRKTESTIADGFQNASILFADLTGFTRLSLKLKPDAHLSLAGQMREYPVLCVNH
jgi:adenylate cyclase